jgi:hypothetical protein
MDRAVQRRLVSSFHVAKKGRFRPVLLALFAAAALVWTFRELRRRRA